MKIKNANKRFLFPSLLVAIPAASLLIVSTLTRFVWEGAAFWTIVFTVIALLPLLYPSSDTWKELLCDVARPVAPFALGAFLVFSGTESSIWTCETGLILFGVALAFLIYTGRNRGIGRVLLCALFAMCFSFLLNARFDSNYAVLCITLTTSAMLLAAAACNWFGGDNSWLSYFIAVPAPSFAVFSLGAEKTADFLVYLQHITEGHEVSYLGYESVRAHLSQMRFVGATVLWDPAGKSFPEDYHRYEARLLVILGHKIGWIAYLLVGLLLVALIVGFVLLAIRRKGLGRFLPIAALCVIAVPIGLFLLTNLGIIDWGTYSIPLFTGNLAVNVAAMLLIRLSITYQSDPEAYLHPEKSRSLQSILSEDEEDDDEDSSEIPGLGQLRVFFIPANECTETLCREFEGQNAISLKGDFKSALKDKDLLFSRFIGRMGDIASVFKQLKYVDSREHFIKITVSEESNISRLMLSVERITHAMTEQNNVDYCLCVSEDIPENIFAVQIVSVKEDT